MTTSPDFDPTPAQSGLLDEHEAEPLSQTPAGIVAKKPDGTMIEITPEGEVNDVENDERPSPVELEPGVIDGFATEIPVEEGEPNPEDFKPPEVALAVDTRDSADVYRAMDRNDEVLILEELMGRAIKTMLYSFSQSGTLMTDFTVGGVNETIRLMNERGGTQVGISSQQPIVDEFTENNEKYYRVMVFARDGRHPESGRWGTAVEPAMMEKKDGKKKWDKFALTKALNKAQRNALRAFIPEDFRQTIIAMYLDKGSVRELKPLGGGAVAELPPALDDERAQALKAEIHDAYKALNALNRLRMPPARFNGFLTRAETESHERLEAFRDQIKQLVDEETKAQAANAG
jgi:hypothetical protein